MIVYGANCTWWDDISKTARTPGDIQIPCCPHCGSVLFQMEELKWNKSAEAYEKRGHPGYVKMMGWARGKCFSNIDKLREAYNGK